MWCFLKCAILILAVASSGTFGQLGLPSLKTLNIDSSKDSGIKLSLLGTIVC